MGQSDQARDADELRDTSTPTPVEEDEPKRPSDVLEKHRGAEAKLEETRAMVQERFADNPAVLKLSDDMQEGRRQLSHDHPEMSERDYLYAAMRHDAELQFTAAARGDLTSDDARDVPASSAAPFFNTLIDSPPDSLASARDAVASVVIGGTTQVAFGTGPEDLSEMGGSFASKKKSI